MKKSFIRRSKDKKISTAAFALFVSAAAIFSAAAVRYIIFNTSSEPTVPTLLYTEVDAADSPVKDGRIDINTAGKDELMLIDGIGSATADRIIAYREENGAICSAEELLNIKGISGKKLGGIAEQIYIAPEYADNAVRDMTPETSVTSVTPAADMTSAMAAVSDESTSAAESISIDETTVPAEEPVTEKPVTEKEEPVWFDLNTASAEQLMRIDGIGEVTAGDIIAYREEHGGFSSVDELLCVKGIGEKKLAVLSEHLYVENAAPARISPDESSEGLVNINTASLEELCTLDGIGEVIAGRIIEYREENGPFGSVDELIDVKGIGEKKLEDIRDRICV